jgi:hypothetical protein
MKTPYSGHATIGDHEADVDISNVDVLRWKGTATNVHGVVVEGAEAIVTLLEQPRPGWSARATAIRDADGVVHLEGCGQFFAPQRQSLAPGNRSPWIKKLPRP